MCSKLGLLHPNDLTVIATKILGNRTEGITSQAYR